MQKLLESIWVPQTPDEAATFAPDALRPISKLKKLQTAAVVAGLLTEPRHHVNAVRLDWLQRLVLSTANGKIKPSKENLETILNISFEAARIVRLEDPIEDFFCDAIPTSRGDFLILVGHWEHAAAYTDTVIQTFELLPETDLTKYVLNAAYSLLRLSDALARRSNVERYAFEPGEQWGKMLLPSTERLRAIARRVTFYDSDLKKLDISKEALAPFVLDEKHHLNLIDAIPGESPLEFHPLASTPNGILVLNPGAMSLAVRALLLLAAKGGGFEAEFCHRLMIVQEVYSEWTGFWPTREIQLTGPNKDGLRGSVCKFSSGRFLHVIQLPVSLRDFPDVAFGRVVAIDEQTTLAIREDIEHFWQLLFEQEDYREAITVILMGGWGGGYAFEPKLDERKFPAGWRYLPLSFADAAQLGACKEGKLHSLWRVIAQVELLEELGYHVDNINGTMNLFGNWRATNGQVIPEHMVDMEPPCNIMMPIDDLFEPRVEAARNRDLRALPFTDGTFKRAQRIDWGPDGLKPVYGSIDDALSQRLIGAIAQVNQIWWIEAVQGSAEPVSFDWLYQVWNAAMQWLAEAAPQIRNDFGSRLHTGPRYVCIVVEEGDGSQNREDANDADPFQHIEVFTDTNGMRSVRLGARWIEALWQTENKAERAFAVTLLEQLLADGEGGPTRDEISQSILRGVPSSDWRWLHAFEVKSVMERMSAGGLVEKFRKIPLSASSLVKCGSVWRFHNRSDGYEFHGAEECRDFLRSYYDFVLGDLIEHIKGFNREQLILASAQRYQAARDEQRIWRTSIRALRSIRGEAADLAAMQRQNEINAVQRTSKVICEIAACEASESGGAEASREDLDEMYSRALLLFGNGQLYSTIRAGLVPPHLKISPGGDLLSDRSVFEKTLLPATERHHAKALDEAAENYAVRAEKPANPQVNRIHWDKDFRDAVEAEFFTSAEALVDLAPALLQLAEKRGEGVFTLKRSEIASWLEDDKHYPEGEIAALLGRLTLIRRESWGKKEDWLVSRDLDLSRFDRPNSLINRPLLDLSGGDDPIVLVSPMMISDALVYAVGTLHEGSLHGEFWSSSKARQYAGRRADELGREFEDEVAARLRGFGLAVSVRRTLNDILQQSSDTDLGDVDVFASSADNSKVWVIEAKNLRLCRTETEVAARMTEYRGQSRPDKNGVVRPDKMLRHLNRVKYLRNHVQKLGQYRGLVSAPEVIGLMVVDAPQPMNFHMADENYDARSCMIDDLASYVSNY
jgi:hypothetical protein